MLAKPGSFYPKQCQIYSQEHNLAGLQSLCLGCLLVEAAAGSCCAKIKPSACGQGWWLEGAFFGCQQMLATLQMCSAGVGGMLLRMYMAAGHFNPLELHSSSSTSGRKEPNTLEDLLKTILFV